MPVFSPIMLLKRILTQIRRCLFSTITVRQSSQVRYVRPTLWSIIRRIMWPPGLMYTASGQPAVYEQLTLPLFVTGYLAVVDTVKLGLKEVMLKILHELMVDAVTYGCKLVRIYHAVWLQQLENGWADWKVDHPADHHISSYCLTTARRVYSHQEQFFTRKIYDGAATN